MILIELTAAINSGGTTQTFYVSSDRFVSEPSDTPPSTYFAPAVLDPGSLGISAFGDGRTAGGSRLEVGEITLANTDGQFDAWLNYSFDGRPVVIRSGTTGAYPAAYPVVLRATVESVQCSRSTMVFRLRDKQFVLDLPVQTSTYAGSNVLPAGLEGTADDLKGKLKPKVYGKVLNIAPPLVNTSKLTYQVNDGIVASIDAVYDRGAAKTFSTDYATGAALQAATLSAGSGLYSTCKSEGYIRLHDSPAGLITADVTQGATSAARTAAQILKALALAVGVSAGDISAADVAALDTDNSSVLGLWLDVDSRMSATEAMNAVALSVGAYFAFDGTGVLRMGRLTTPSGTAVLDLTKSDCVAVERRAARDTAIPAWSVTVNHTKLWARQDSDLATSVTDARRAYLARETRSSVSTDSAIKTQYLLASSMVTNTVLTSASDATTEAARLLALFKVRRDVFDVTVPLDVLTSVTLKLTDVVTLTLDRFGLDAGKSLRLIGLRTELRSNRAILTLWG